jgi:hypothetical protein
MRLWFPIHGSTAPQSTKADRLECPLPVFCVLPRQRTPRALRIVSLCYRRRARAWRSPCVGVDQRCQRAWCRLTRQDPGTATWRPKRLRPRCWMAPAALLWRASARSVVSASPSCRCALRSVAASCRGRFRAPHASCGVLLCMAPQASAYGSASAPVSSPSQILAHLRNYTEPVFQVGHCGSWQR